MSDTLISVRKAKVFLAANQNLSDGHKARIFAKILEIVDSKAALSSMKSEAKSDDRLSIIADLQIKIESIHDRIQFLKDPTIEVTARKAEIEMQLGALFELVSDAAAELKG